MSTLSAVELVMRSKALPMSVREIVIAAGDSLPTKSITPDTVVARDLSINLKKFAEESLFTRTAPGRYTLREFVTAGLVRMGDVGETPLSSHPTKSTGQTSTSTVIRVAISKRLGMIRSNHASGADAAQPALLR